jgi:ribosomal protein S12 methylthiotransferase accessory factor YcaO
VSEPIYSRAPDVVWRLGPDRVLVRRISASGDDAAADLLGDAALIWIALDEPATAEVLTAYFLEGGMDSGGLWGGHPAFNASLAAAVTEMLQGRWVRAGSE